MDNFLSALHFYCTEQIQLPKDPQYQENLDRILDLEEQLTAALGRDFLLKCEKAINDCRYWDQLAQFREGLRFGFRFAQEIQQSSSSSAP